MEECKPIEDYGVIGDLHRRESASFPAITPRLLTRMSLISAAFSLNRALGA